jgi:pimeloyl-ACP methyl ester carboxylesterase
MQITVNGHDIFVANGGRAFDPSLPVVVLLHGAGFDSSTWALHTRWFAHHGYAVLAPDLPGHGRSGGEALTSIGDLADWTAALITAAGANSARLIGHSMGSLIALETAARHPNKVTRLDLLGTAATMTVGPDLLKDAEAANWLQEVDQNLPVSEFNDVADRLMTAAPTVVRKQNHAVGISVRQTAA